MKAVLKSLSDDIQCFASAQNALSSFEHTFPNCIVVDLMMPCMDGIQFAKVFRSTYSECRTPIFLCSGHLDDGVIKEAIHAGINHVLEKPFSPIDLVQRIDYALNREMFSGSKSSMGMTCDRFGSTDINLTSTKC
jgi:CheY-like chemotaxis protein